MAGQVFGGGAPKTKPVPAPKPVRAVGQDAVLNGKPVKWGGDDYGWQSPQSFSKINQPQSPAPTPSYQGPGGDPSGSGRGQAQQNPAPIDPRMGAATDTISMAEGTWDEDANSVDYTMRFGDRKGEGSLDLSAPHPEDVRTSIYGSGRRSNASGGFQFLDSTWKELNGGVNAVMSPHNQDRAAGELLLQTGFDPSGDFSTEISKAAGKWASLPNLQGKSHYNQPVKKREDLTAFYNDRLASRELDNRMRVYAERGGSGTSSASSFQPPAEMVGPQQDQAPETIAAPSPAPTSSGSSYAVQAGDTVYSLARRFGLSPDELAKRNNLADPNQISIGQSLTY